jgi:DNA-binding NarL/FixJ family response regulator
MTGTSPQARSKVVIIEDHDLFAETLDLALSMEGYLVRRLPPPARAGSPHLLLSAVARVDPRVVLLDLDLGAFGDASRLITPMAKQGANIVVVTASADRTRWGGCLYYGARKVLTKTQPLNEILSVVRRLNRGLAVQDRHEREALLHLWHEQDRSKQEIRARFDLLTPRERQVLLAMMDGVLVRDIARQSVVSEATVRTQVKSILSKLGVSSQLAAVGMAHQIDWRPSDQ